MSRFRTSLWPGTPLPHPGLFQALYTISDGVIAFAGVKTVGEVSELQRRFALSDAEHHELLTKLARGATRAGLRDVWELVDAGEIYLELEAVDLEDQNAILVFVNRFGPLGVGSDGYSTLRDLPWYRDVLRDLAAQQVPFGASVHLAYGGVRPVASAETIGEFRFGARVLRDLRRAFVCLEEDRAETMTWESVPENARPGGKPLEFAGEASEIPAGRDDERELARFLETVLTQGLTVFHPRVKLTGPERRPEHGWLAGATVPFYSACCLELYNHIAERAQYRRCENERCRRLFVRQKGRAAAGQHRREGVKYCSSYCARAVAQRRYRERRRHGG